MRLIFILTIQTLVICSKPVWNAAILINKLIEILGSRIKARQIRSTFPGFYSVKLALTPTDRTLTHTSTYTHTCRASGFSPLIEILYWYYTVIVFLYNLLSVSEFDQHEINLYEEVAKMPPFNRKTLVLIGAQGVGRRSLISKLVLNEPDKFGNTMPR